MVLADVDARPRRVRPHLHVGKIRGGVKAVDLQCVAADMKIPHYGGSFLAELENEGVVTSAANERCPVVGHKGVVGRAAPDIGEACGADNKLRGVGVLRSDVAGVALGGKKGVGLHHVGVGVALDDIR